MNSRKSIVIVDVLLILGLLICLLSDKNVEPQSAWASWHCIAGTLWFALTIVHVRQHWKLIKAFHRSMVRCKNRITTITIVVLLIMFLSISALVITTKQNVVSFHNVFSHVYLAVIILHLATKSRRLLAIIKVSLTN